MREIKRIIIHHSASSYGSANVFRKWHVEENKWRDVGYHFIILNGKIYSNHVYKKHRDGIVETGRPIEEQGAHTKNKNVDSIGICLVGNDEFTDRQFVELDLLIKKLIAEYPKIEEIAPHKKYNDTSCPGPGIDMDKFDIAFYK